jgi:Protein of unknown function, DUF547
MTTAPIARTLAALPFSGILLVAQVVAADFDQTHALFTTVLEQHVRDARVDYAALKAKPTDLTRYLDQIAAVSRADFARWSEPARIAFLTNAYNAYTLRLIIDHHPVKSIKDIGSLLKGPWDQPSVQLFGETTTLNTLEHKILRVDYAEPRLHFALICAAKGCPPLRREAYVAERLDEQLSDQAREFLATTAKNRIEIGERTVYLSPIFKWYGGDFEKQSGSVLKALEPYWPAGAGAGAAGDFKIRYTDYDWSLNEQVK